MIIFYHIEVILVVVVIDLPFHRIPFFSCFISLDNTKKKTCFLNCLLIIPLQSSSLYTHSHSTASYAYTHTKENEMLRLAACRSIGAGARAETITYRPGIWLLLAQKPSLKIVSVYSRLRLPS